jgi:hypothetical protein
MPADFTAGMNPDLRAAKILTRARALFRRNAPGQEWPSPFEEQDKFVREMQLGYLRQPEQQLRDEGIIE